MKTLSRFVWSPCLVIKLLMLWSSAALGGEEALRVQYVSVDLIYLDHGKNADLAVGDVLYVLEAKERKATLKVVSVAMSSASCSLVDQSGEVRVGDTVIKGPRAARETQATPTPAKRPEANLSSPSTGRTTPEKSVRQRQKLVRGTLSLQYYQYIDELNGRDFQQPGLRLNLRGNRLFGSAYDFRVRTRTRYDQRESAIPGVAPETEWKNRIYEASFGYGDESARFNWRAGRIIARKFSGVGYLDGGLMEARVAGPTRVGIFAGTQPEWQHSDLRTSLKKYGAYFQFQQGPPHQGFESTLALAGEYHGSTINREFAFIRNRWSKGRHFQLYQSAEIEINRDWREEKAGERLSLSNLHAYGRFQINEAVNFGLSYDDRQNYYTYELRNRDDLYFDTLSRRGLRANLQVRFSRNIRGRAHYGTRRREGEETGDTSHYAANLFWRNVLARNWSLNLKLNGFSNQYTEGANPAIQIGRRLGGHTFHLGYSSYDYTFLTTATKRRTEWLRLETFLALGRRFYLSSQIEANTGDDAEGFRIFTDVGYRL